jgi:predicted ribosomally synthesized peptide with SipW-like signal peptide
VETQKASRTTKEQKIKNQKKRRRKTMTKKKITLILAATVLIVSLIIGGSLAYLTDDASVTNTFTMGDIAITLDEPAWVPADGLGMLPGDNTPKDPTVTAVDGDSYMRLVVEIVDTTTGNVITDTARIDLILATINNGASVGFNTTNFTLDTTLSTDGVLYYNFNGIFTETSTATLFTNIIVPTSYDRDDVTLMGAFSIRLTAQAIQSANFADAATALAELPTL